MVTHPARGQRQVVYSCQIKKPLPQERHSLFSVKAGSLAEITSFIYTIQISIYVYLYIQAVYILILVLISLPGELRLPGPETGVGRVSTRPGGSPKGREEHYRG